MDRIFMDEYYEHLRADNIEAFSKERNCLKDWDLSICLTIAMN